MDFLTGFGLRAAGWLHGGLKIIILAGINFLLVMQKWYAICFY
jgi:hypothetical protein